MELESQQNRPSHPRIWNCPKSDSVKTPLSEQSDFPGTFPASLPSPISQGPPQFPCCLPAYLSFCRREAPSEGRRGWGMSTAAPARCWLHPFSKHGCRYGRRAFGVGDQGGLCANCSDGSSTGHAVLAFKGPGGEERQAAWPRHRGEPGMTEGLQSSLSWCPSTPATSSEPVPCHCCRCPNRFWTEVVPSGGCYFLLALLPRTPGTQVWLSQGRGKQPWGWRGAVATGHKQQEAAESLKAPSGDGG